MSENVIVTPASCRQSCGLQIRHRGRLPHWEIEGAIYFVTFRLYDSIPKETAEKYRFERDDILKTAQYLNRPLTEIELKRLKTLYSQRIKNYLDQNIGHCYLRQNSIAQMMQNTLEYFDKKRYILYAWCIMPNHVHVVFQPINNYTLDKVLHSWKSYSASQANKLLIRSGHFWQREYYDHIIRNENDFNRIIDYVLENPTKIGLKDWPWVKVCSAK